MAQFFARLFTLPGLGVSFLLLAALSPTTAFGLLENILSVLTPFAGPILLLSVVFYGMSTILRGGKR